MGLAFSTADAVCSGPVQVPDTPMPDIQVPAMPREMRRETLADLRLWAPALRNFPSGFLGLARRTWVLQGMLPEFWRSISWPFVGIFFWWIAGRGIEALVASRRRVLSPTITWFEVLVASLVIAFCAALCVGLLPDASFRDELIYPWRLVPMATGLWILLGVATVTARLVQWPIGRQLRNELATAPTLSSLSSFSSFSAG